jgi:hypothetical protein
MARIILAVARLALTPTCFARTMSLGLRKGGREGGREGVVENFKRGTEISPHRT